MKDQELIRKIKLLKYLRVGGEPSRDFVAKNREILMMQVKNTCENRTPATREINFKEIRGFVSSLMPANLNQYVFRPVMAMLLILGVISSGWVASVSASMNSLPGDTLYSLKIATERAQLALTGGADNKAKLQVEFAGRRLEEVSKIAETPSPEKVEKMTVAVNNFKEQMGSVKASLEVVKETSSPLEVAEVAKIVDRKTSEYHAVLVKTEAQLPAPSQTQMTEAKQLVDETGLRAVQVIVENHLDDQTAVNQAEVLSKVEEKLKTVESSIADVNAKLEQVAADQNQINISTSTLQAQATLNEAKVLLEKNDVGAAIAKIVEGNNLVKEAETIAVASGIVAATSTGNTAVSGTLSSPLHIYTGTVTTTPKMDIKYSAQSLEEFASGTEITAQSVESASTSVEVNAQAVGGEEEIIIPETLIAPEENPGLFIK